jgi:GTP cyclohydrolase II
LDVKDINLLTNNPEKVKYVVESNIHLNSRVPLQIPANEISKGYLQTKKIILVIYSMTMIKIKQKLQK